MQSINSSELFGNTSMSTGAAPRHAPEGHERCTFYPAELHPDNVDPKGGFKLGPMVCPHGVEASGGFYSEDYVRELVTACQRMYTAMAANSYSRLTPLEAQLFTRVRDLTK